MCVPLFAVGNILYNIFTFRMYDSTVTEFNNHMFYFKQPTYSEIAGYDLNIPIYSEFNKCIVMWKKLSRKIIACRGFNNLFSCIARNEINEFHNSERYMIKDTFEINIIKNWCGLMGTRDLKLFNFQVFLFRTQKSIVQYTIPIDIVQNINWN